jgi:hypothetical protein
MDSPMRFEMIVPTVLEVMVAWGLLAHWCYAARGKARGRRSRD